MKCYVYAFYNKKIGAYEKPIVNNYDKETFTQLVIRDVLVSDNAAKDRMAECSLYHLGSYDDENGLMLPLAKPDFVLDLSQLIVGKTEGETHA